MSRPPKFPRIKELRKVSREYLITDELVEGGSATER